MNQQGSDPGSRKAQGALLIFLLVLLPSLVFANTLHNAYHLDDFGRIAENPEIDRVFPIWRHFLDPRTSTTVPTIVQYRPLLPLSLSINAAVGEAIGLERLTALHVGNVLIHILSGLILFGLLQELLSHWSRSERLIRRRCEIAFVAAMAFAIHPISGVPVNYLAARDLLLMQFFLLWAFWTYLRMRRRGETLLRWTAVLTLLACSLLSKTNAVAAPLLILAFELLPGGERPVSWRLWRRVLPFGVLVGAFFLFTKLVLQFSDADMLMVERKPFEYPLTQAKVHLFYYLRNFCWPFYMRPLPQIESVQSLVNLQAWGGALLILGSLWTAWQLRRRAALASFSILAYWILFSPTSSLLPFRMLAADYRQYPSLPFLCLSLALAWCLLRRPRARWVVAGSFLTYFAIGSVWMNRVWETEESLWRHSVVLGATSIAHHNYAHSQSGKDDVLAEKHYREAVRLEPINVRSYIGLGLLQIRQGKIEEGLGEVRRAVELAPDWALTHYWLARALSDQGRLEEAADESRQAWRLDPRNLEYAYQAAFDAQKAKRHQESLEILEALHNRQPSYKDSRFMEGFALQMLGRNEEAVQLYRSYREQNPDHVQACFNLGYALMRIGDFQEAIEEFQRTLALRPEYLEAHLHLAACYRAVGNPEMADRHLRNYRGGESR